MCLVISRILFIILHFVVLLMFLLFVPTTAYMVAKKVTTILQTRGPDLEEVCSFSRQFAAPGWLHYGTLAFKSSRKIAKKVGQKATVHVRLQHFIRSRVWNAINSTPKARASYTMETNLLSCAELCVFVSRCNAVPA